MKALKSIPLFKLLRHIALPGVFALALLAITGTGCGGGGGGGGDIPPFTSENDIAAADLNGDGFTDIALAATYLSHKPPHPGYVYIYLQDRFSPGNFLSPSRYDVGSDPWGLTVADINNDGLPDIAVANNNSDDISILFQNETLRGKFLTAKHISCGKYPNAVAIGDLNGDGRADIVTANGDSDNGVSILFKDPGSSSDGDFLPAVKLSTGSGGESVALGDLNDDGLTDIAVDGAASVFVMFQNEQSPGGFFSPASLSAGERPRWVAIHDLNDDGFNDMAVANAGSSSDGTNAGVSVFIQNPNQPGHFLAKTNYPTANGAQKLVADDFNNDDKPDLAIATVVYQSQSSGRVSVLLQNPSSPGIFLTAKTYSAGFTPNFIAAGDCDADGLIDIAVNEGPSILFQNAGNEGSFLPVTIVGDFFDD